MTLHRIASIEPRSGYRLLVRWTSGDQSVADFSGDIGNAPVWKALRDERLFARARVTDHGTAIEWPVPSRPNGDPAIDVDADGLWHMAAEQQSVVAAE